jgi:hypothetical protein
MFRISSRDISRRFSDYQSSISDYSISYPSISGYQPSVPDYSISYLSISDYQPSVPDYSISYPSISDYQPPIPDYSISYLASILDHHCLNPRSLSQLEDCELYQRHEYVNENEHSQDESCRRLDFDVQ